MLSHVSVLLGFLMVSLCFSACSGGSRGGGTTSVPAFTVGGSVSGLDGTLVLQNNGDDDLTITADGPFTFPSAATAGSPYLVTVKSKPVDQACLVTNGAGTIIASSVTTVSVSCFITGASDITFGAPDGFTAHHNAAGGNADDAGSAMALDSQGRVLVTGSSRNAAGNLDMAVWRFLADGTLDPSFNGSGFVVHDGAAGGAGDDAGNAIAVDSLDRVLVAGRSGNSSGNADSAVWRINEDGTLDDSWNGSGFVVRNGIAGGNGDDAGNALVIDALNRIVIAGTSANSAGNADLAVWRLNPNGTLDTSFAATSIVVQGNAAGGDADDAGSAMTLDGEGRILVVGSSRNAAGNLDMVVWRILENGSLDAAFNGTGFVVHDNAASGAGDDAGNAVAVDGQGRILVAGSSRNVFGDADLAIWRFLEAGTLDTAFAEAGVLVNNGAAGSNGDDAARALLFDSQERVLVAGSSRNPAGDADMVLWRFEPDGSIDITFASNGIVASNNAAGGNADDSGNAVAMNSQGIILVAGSSGNAAGDKDLVVWGFLP
jgi:uncharacterized delta-60 repeat protein